MKKYKKSEKLFTLLFSPKIFIKIISKPITFKSFINISHNNNNNNNNLWFLLLFPNREVYDVSGFIR